MSAPAFLHMHVGERFPPVHLSAKKASLATQGLGHLRLAHAGRSQAGTQGSQGKRVGQPRRPSLRHRCNYSEALIEVLMSGVPSCEECATFARYGTRAPCDHCGSKLICYVFQSLAGESICLYLSHNTLTE